MSSTATVGHYKPVSLKAPDAATDGLAGLVDSARKWIQTAVDLLGTGDPGQAPDFVKLLQDKGLAEVKNGHSAMADNYATKMSKLDDIKSDLDRQDKGVANWTYIVGGIPEEKWSIIKGRVDKLQKALDAAQAAFDAVPHKDTDHLSPSVEVDLQQTILDTIVDVFGDIEDANKQMLPYAGNIEGSSPTVGGAPVSYPNTFVPVDSSGGYDRSHTAPLGSYSGSNAPNQLKRDAIVKAIEGALDALKITDPNARKNWIDGYYTLIMRESSGDAGSINRYDINAQEGHPSQGLTQVIPENFTKYHAANTSNSITDPVANIASSMNYVMDRWQVSRDGANLTTNVQQADSGRDPHWY